MDFFSPESEHALLFWVGLPATCILVLVNIPLLWIVWNKQKTSLINQLIGVDCLVSLLHIPMLIHTARIIVLPCWIRKDAIFILNGVFMSLL